MRRNESIDFSKGMLIIGVTYGHVVTALENGVDYIPWLYAFVRSFDMPMFAFISGVLLARSFERHSITYNLASKILLTIVPAFIWELLIWGILLRTLPDGFGSIWYLYSIGIVLCVMILTIWLLRRFPIAVTYIAFLIENVLFHTIIIDPFNVGFLLFPACVGFILSKHNVLGFSLYKKIDVKKIRVAFLFLFIVFVVMELFWKTDYNVWNSTCNVIKDENITKNVLVALYRGAIGVIGSVVMYIIYVFIHILLEKRSFCARVDNIIVRLGQFTEPLYILQNLFVSVLGVIAVHRITLWLGFNPFMWKYKLMSYLFAPIITMISLFAMYWVGKLLERIPIIGIHIFGIKLSVIEKKAGSSN